MPASADGQIVDVHVTAFQSSIDSLLVAGRSSTPSSVLGAMRQVVAAVSTIDADVQTAERTSRRSLPEADAERVVQLKGKCNATLSNLVTAAKNHATSAGLSPVSLLDAAASHLSVTVIDLVKILRVRKATMTELSDAEDLRAPSPAVSVRAPAAAAPQPNGRPELVRTGSSQRGQPPPLRLDAVRRDDFATRSAGPPSSRSVAPSAAPLSASLPPSRPNDHGGSLHSPSTYAGSPAVDEVRPRSPDDPRYDGRAGSSSGSAGGPKVFDSPPRHYAQDDGSFEEGQPIDSYDDVKVRTRSLGRTDARTGVSRDPDRGHRPLDPGPALGDPQRRPSTAAQPEPQRDHRHRVIDHRRLA